MSWKIVQLSIFLAVVMVGHSSAQDAQNSYYFLDGNELSEKCKNDKASAAFYIMSVHDATEWLTKLGVHRLYCPPANGKTQQVLDIVCQYLDKNPSTRHYSGGWQIQTSLIAAWPCPK